MIFISRKCAIIKKVTQNYKKIEEMNVKIIQRTKQKRWLKRKTNKQKHGKRHQGTLDITSAKEFHQKETNMASYLHTRLRKIKFFMFNRVNFREIDISAKVKKCNITKIRFVGVLCKSKLRLASTLLLLNAELTRAQPLKNHCLL